jgi:hypothetical protein
MRHDIEAMVTVRTPAREGGFVAGGRLTVIL